MSKPRRVLIIGGGPSGLVTLRNFLLRGDFERVELVERRDDVGGVWYLDHACTGDTPRWPSPAYPGLVGNVLPKFLTFSQHPFDLPPSSSAYPYATLQETHAYLRSFAEPFIAQGSIKLNTEVIAVEETANGWKVVVKDWSKETNEKEENWDAVVIATAWYDHPVWPKTEGLAEAKAKELAQHAKWWRGPLAYKGKRVLVVGNGNSGNDISAQLTQVTQIPVHRSIRHPTIKRFVFLPDSRIVDVAPVSRYVVSPDKASLDIHLTDGTSIKDVDTVIIATGYACAVPFLRVLDRSTQSLSPLSTPSVNPRFPSLHRHILYAPNPTLALIGAIVSATPFAVADMASTWLGLAWSGNIDYPPTLEGRLVSESERLKEIEKIRANTRTGEDSALLAYHVLGDFELPYIRMLREDIVQTRPEWDDILDKWDDKMWGDREAMYAVKYKSLQAARDEGRAVGNLPVSA